NPIAPVPQFLKQDLLDWTNAFISLLNDLIRLQLNVKPHLLINPDQIQLLMEINQLYSLSALLALQKQLQQSRQWLLNHSIHLNSQLLLENILIEWSRARII